VEIEDVTPALRERLGPAATAGMVATFEATRQEWAAEVTALSVERFERRLTDELTTLRAVMREGHAAHGAAVHDVSAALRQEIRAQRAELLKWAVALGLAQAAITGVIVGFGAS
jgi:hypothetical protein